MWSGYRKRLLLYIYSFNDCHITDCHAEHGLIVISSAVETSKMKTIKN